MDIVVELEDGSIANLEVQKVGYLFPGQRSACYSADLLLRQYKRVRDETAEKKRFSYRSIKNVYTIVLFEKSPKEFHDYPNECYHFFEQKSNTGLKMELLQKYLFIPLDIFQKSKHNGNKKVRRDAWLTLFSSDDPDTIIELIEEYSEFRQIYREAYEICMNMEKVMDMFSKELYELDKIAEKYMVSEQQEIIAEQQEKIAEQKRKIDEMQEEHKKKMDEAQKQGIRITVKILQDEEVPEQKIRQRICERYQISEEQAWEFFD